MRILLLLLALAFINIVHAQDLPFKDGKVFYENIDSATGTKDQLYQKAKLWFADAFKDSKSVVQVDDKEDGQIVGKGNVFAPVKVMGMLSGNYCFFTVKIDLKDNKYRLQLYNLSVGGASTTATMPVEDLLNRHANVYKRSLESIDNAIKGIITGFKADISKTADTDF